MINRMPKMEITDPMRSVRAMTLCWSWVREGVMLMTS